MVRKSSKLCQMLLCTAVSFFQKALVSTYRWVHTWVKWSSCMAVVRECVIAGEQRLGELRVQFVAHLGQSLLQLC